MNTGKKYDDEPKGTVDIVVDVETLDTKPGGIIMNATLIAFDFNGLAIKDDSEAKDYLHYAVSSLSEKAVASVLSLNFPLFESLKHGFTTSADTLDFWSRQNPAVLTELVDLTGCLKMQLSAIQAWVSGLRVGYRRLNVWANSPSFDLVLLHEYYRKLSMDYPFRHTEEMDIRTLRKVFNLSKLDTGALNLRAHFPVDDCYLEAMDILRARAPGAKSG